MTVAAVFLRRFRSGARVRHTVEGWAATVVRVTVGGALIVAREVDASRREFVRVTASEVVAE